MSSFADLPVSVFLDRLASPSPTPGGGSAAAITGAMGAALLAMVTGLTKSRTGADAERLPLVLAGAALTPLRRRLARLADEDAASFDEVMAAYRLPKATDAEKAVRQGAIQAALVHATIVPLETLRACADALAHAEAVARCGNPSAASDIGVSIALLEAAASGAEANVRINLEGVRDQAGATRLDAESGMLAARARQAGAAARAALA